MPVYGFTCDRCGPFEVTRSMRDASAPARCPSCAGEARRVFHPPGLALLSAPVRTALDREERSAHEPEVTARKRGRPLHHGHAHGAAPPWVLSH